MPTTFAQVWRGRVLPLATVFALLAPSPLHSQSTPPPATLQRFEVTGSRIQQTDIAGPAPIRVISRQDLDLAAPNNLVEVMRTLPEIGYSDIQEGNNLGFVRGATGVDLRGLGPNNTLVLVNGRRQAPHGIAASGRVFVDLNRFPTAAIERVEILKDGASAVYGADATAGVINVILRRDFTGAELSTRYGNYFKTDAAEQSHAFFGGIARGPFRAQVSLTFSSRNAIAATDLPFSSDPDFTARLKARDPVKYAFLTPTATLSSMWDLRSAASPHATVAVPTAAQLAGVRNNLPLSSIVNPLTGVTSTFLPGTGGVPQGTLGSSTNPASVPRQNNSGRPAATDFVPRFFGPGEGSNLYNFQPFVWIVPESTRRGAATNLAWDATSFATVYANVAFMRIDTESRSAASPITTGGPDYSILVPASNYYNPFGIPLAFTYRPLDFGPRVTNVVSETLDLVAGARGTWRERISWDAGWSYSRNESTDYSHNSMSESRLRAALARNTPDAFNIFGGPGFRNDPATLDFIRVTRIAAGTASTRTFDGSLNTSHLLDLPTGPLGAALHVEHRAERFDTENDPLSTELDDIIGSTRAPSATRSRRDVQSVALEFQAPLMREGRFRLLHTAVLHAAARFEKFSEGYDSGVKPSVALRLRPFRSLLLRASYNEVFRAPTLPQLFAGVLDNTVTALPDLRRPVALTGDSADAGSAPRLVRQGGNPALRPEDGATQQAGVVIDVPWAPLRGLSFEVTHGQISNSDVIRFQLGTLFIRQNELTSTGDLVIREPGEFTFRNNTNAPIPVLSGPGGLTTPIAPGQTATVPGRIVMIQDTALNLSNQVVRYVDYGLQLDREVPRLGRWLARTTWTYYAEHGVQRQTGEGYLSSEERALPRYRGQGSLQWSRGPWNTNIGFVYIHRTWDITRDFIETGRYTTYSAGIGYRFKSSRWLRDVDLSLGIDNLFDRDPPLDTFTNGYNQTLISRPAGRFGFIAVKRKL